MDENAFFWVAIWRAASNQSSEGEVVLRRFDVAALERFAAMSDPELDADSKLPERSPFHSFFRNRYSPSMKSPIERTDAQALEAIRFDEDFSCPGNDGNLYCGFHPTQSGALWALSDWLRRNEDAQSDRQETPHAREVNIHNEVTETCMVGMLSEAAGISARPLASEIMRLLKRRGYEPQIIRYNQLKNGRNC